MNQASVGTNAIVFDLQATEKESAIRELLVRAGVFRCVGEVDTLIDSVLLRERNMSTGFGRGVAIAHGESSCIDEAIVALGLSKSGIEFASADGEPVHILFVVVNPSSCNADYLQILSTLSALLRSDQVRGDIRSCGCIEEVASTLDSALSDLEGQGVKEGTA